MAIKQVRIDDLDGTEGAREVEFGLEGVEYLIDLTEKNIQTLRKALSPFTESARKQPGRRPRKSAKVQTAAHRPTAERVMDLDAIRTWARGTGKFKVSDRGRIPRDVVDAFNEAHMPNAAPVQPAFSGV